MKTIDILILIAIFIAAFIATHHMITRKKKCKCGGCSSCARAGHCPHCEKPCD